MKTTKRITAMILALLLLLTAAAAGAEASSELPYVKLLYVNYGDAPSEGNFDEVWAKINEMLLRDLNCEVEIEWLGSSDPLNKIALKYAGNEEFDFAYTANWFGYADNAQKNAFREITEEDIATYMPNVCKIYDQNVWNQTRINDKIFMVPVNTKKPRQHVCVILRGDLREKYGLPEPQNLEDIEAYLTAVAENEPGMDGFLTQEHIYHGFFYDDSNYCYSNALGISFYVPETENIKLFSRQFTDNYEVFVKKAHEWYEKGFWSADAIANDAAQTVNFNTRFIAGQTALNLEAVENVEGQAKTIGQEHPEWKPEIYYLNAGRHFAYNTQTADGTTITRNSKNYERALMVIDKLLGDPEYNHLIQFGFEGVNYELDENGLYTALEIFQPGCNWNYVNDDFAFIPKDSYQNVPEILAQRAKDSVVHPMMSVVLDKSPVETQYANVMAVHSEYERALLYGMYDDPVAALQEYRQALKDAGIDEIIAEFQKQVDAYFAK